ncbi:MAG: cobalamin biosynthesis protein CobD [Rhizobiales bacterium]|nr:adenosylcobinamide-phosphate synthase CbiB [Hyphomicrobiales bacterium]NRB13583.1 cobalamin biosynthesis protein CobD [Hyphomicrobiales bacterium]
MNFIWVMIAAMIVDIALGDPAWLYRIMSHPVVYFGKIISFFDKYLNDWQLGKTTLIMRGYGVLILLFLIGLTLGYGLEFIFSFSLFLLPIKIFAISLFLAIRSLYKHVRDVYDALNIGLNDGKAAVAKIVGRNVTKMTEITVTRAAIESLAENLSDGVIAPIFWYLVGGLPALIAYKMVNTADSMIGHKNFKYLHFGRASALSDDILNYIPARITAALFWLMALLGGGINKAGRLWTCLWNDAVKHASPNAGWPEAAMALMMEIALGGPRVYGENQVDGVWMNEQGRKILHRADIKQALKLYVMSLILVVFLMLPLGLIYQL